YPSGLDPESLADVAIEAGYRFGETHLATFRPVMQMGKRLGTVYIRADMSAMYERFYQFIIIIALVTAVSLFVAYLLSLILQRRISRPILALAQTARMVSERGDYSARAVKHGEDEVGLLTDAFNAMLREIQRQNLESERAEE